jgi:hypothetical protein
MKKGKTFEEFYGAERAEEIKSKIKVGRAKQITPVKDTKIEIKIQSFLKQLRIEFFTHQNLSVSEILNVPSTIKDLINTDIFKVFSDEFKEHNLFAVDCVNVGNFLRHSSSNDQNNEVVDDYILKEMNSR